MFGEQVSISAQNQGFSLLYRSDALLESGLDLGLKLTDRKDDLLVRPLESLLGGLPV